MKAWGLLDTTKFWIVVALLGLMVVTIANVRQNRIETRHSAAVNAAQQAQLTYLCEIVHVQDAIYMAQIRQARLLLFTDKALTPLERSVQRERLRLYQLAHAEFSNTRPCRSVE